MLLGPAALGLEQGGHLADEHPGPERVVHDPRGVTDKGLDESAGDRPTSVQLVALGGIADALKVALAQASGLNRGAKGGRCRQTVLVRDDLALWEEGGELDPRNEASVRGRWVQLTRAASARQRRSSELETALIVLLFLYLQLKGPSAVRPRPLDASCSTTAGWPTRNGRSPPPVAGQEQGPRVVSLASQGREGR